MSFSINGTSGVTYPDASTQATAGFTGFRNRIINGGMVIDQRNAGAAVTGSGAFPVDRWIVDQSIGAKLSSQRSSTAPAGFVNSLAITTATAYSVGADDYYILNQRIEGFNTADLAWGTASAAAVTLSFWVRSSLTGLFGGSLRNSASTRSYPFGYTISVANTWEYKTITVPGDTTGTWLTDNGIGMFVYLGLGVGSTYTGTAGSWAAANYVTCTGATSVVGTNGATFYITGVQLEKGSTATPFEFRPYGTELALCQRYYEVGSFTMYGYGAITELFGGSFYFKTTKRSTPTVATANVSYVNNSGISIGNIALDKAAGMATGTATARQGLLFDWTAASEL